MSKLAISFRNELIRGGYGAAAFLMAVALFAGAETVVEVPLFPPQFDKVAHFTYYGTMAVLLAHAVGIRWLWVPLVQTRRFLGAFVQQLAAQFLPICRTAQS